jgi:hypothetical protein
MLAFASVDSLRGVETECKSRGSPGRAWQLKSLRRGSSAGGATTLTRRRDRVEQRRPAQSSHVRAGKPDSEPARARQRASQSAVGSGRSRLHHASAGARCDTRACWLIGWDTIGGHDRFVTHVLACRAAHDAKCSPVSRRSDASRASRSERLSSGTCCTRVTLGKAIIHWLDQIVSNFRYLGGLRYLA